MIVVVVHLMNKYNIRLGVLNVIENKIDLVKYMKNYKKGYLALYVGIIAMELVWLITGDKVMAMLYFVGVCDIITHIEQYKAIFLLPYSMIKWIRKK